MDKPDILIPRPLMRSILKVLDRDYTTHKLWEMADPEAYLDSVAQMIKGIASSPSAKVDANLVDRLPNLQIVANFGVGYDGIDARHCADRGIMVTNTPDVLTEEVADTALGLLIMAVRELSASERYLRAGKWQSDGPYPLTHGTLRGRKLGIFGLGRIGKAIARRAEAFGLEIHYHGRRKQDGVAYPYHRNLKELAAACDTLMVVAPGGADTRHAVDADVLKALGPNGVVINIGRGSVIDEQALITALKNGVILAAGLDVFEEEPRAPAELIALDNAVLLPHVGSASIHTREAMGSLMLDNLATWFKEGHAVTPVAETSG
ncbi:2-hydroxyacid dehydrogenase [Rhizobiales bacterium]|uniref:2-hydroxyacid dehydrogenase n=1 Tax=Hongsoonwoonella zoysiae TaxID=2821844 RepID=UPI001561766C|nr:2-hydroxyacid dehydrogenase [Hongsoonwoonella zoysiae]NRG17251.1 2-hydroxyacid dehydrogenase [Hongsoonwoonella zoysiae]